jgi:hypothetical protein
LKECQKLEDELLDEIEINKSQKQVIQQIENMFRDQIIQLQNTIKKLQISSKKKDDKIQFANQQVFFFFFCFF